MDKNVKKQEQVKPEDSQSYLNYITTGSPVKTNNTGDNEKASGFTILGHIELALTIIWIIVLALTNAGISITIATVISNIILDAMLYGLGFARERVRILEQKVKDQDKEIKEIKRKIKRLDDK